MRFDLLLESDVCVCESMRAAAGGSSALPRTLTPTPTRPAHLYFRRSAREPRTSLLRECGRRPAAGRARAVDRSATAESHVARRMPSSRLVRLAVRTGPDATVRPVPGFADMNLSAGLCEPHASRAKRTRVSFASAVVV